MTTDMTMLIASAVLTALLAVPYATGFILTRGLYIVVGNREDFPAGTGWIGRNRMEAMLATGEAKAVAICDPNPEMIEAAKEVAPDAGLVGSIEELLECKPDGVVIATPSALHADQCRSRPSGAGAGHPVL